MAVPTQRSFAAGEISPSLYARVDTNKYQNGLRTCRNAYVRKDSGVANRPGTEFVAEVKDSSKTVRLVSVQAPGNVGYTIELGNLYFRVIKDGAYQYDSTKNITGITAASQAVVTSVAHGFLDGEEVYISGVLGMTQINGRNLIISDKTADTFKLKYLGTSTYVNSATWTAYSSAGTASRVHQVVTTYVEADLDSLQFLQSMSVSGTTPYLYIAHPSYPVKYISGLSASWSINSLTIGSSESGPTSQSNSGAAGTTTEWTVTRVTADGGESGISGSTGSSAVPTGGAPITVSWTKTSLTAKIYKKKNGLWGFIGDGDGTALTFVDDGITADTTILPPVAVDPFSGATLYPSVVGASQQRLILASSTTYPEKLWMSQPGAGRYQNFNVSTPSATTDSFNFTLAGKTFNKIKYAVDLGKLVVFTTSGEYVIEGDSSGILKPNDCFPKQASYNGCGDIPPLIVNNNALYIQRDNKTIRDMAFDINVDGYRGNDLTIFSSHLMEDTTVVDWAYQKTPDSVVWIVLASGELLSLTYIKEQEIIGWARHDFGTGLVENVCVSQESVTDVVYVVVKRTINGRTTRYVEKFQDRKFTDILDVAFMDSSLSYDGRNTGATTMDLSGGSTWAYDEDLTLTASASTFVAGDVGNAVFMYYYDTTVGSPTYGEIIDTLRLTITAYTSATVVTVRANKTVVSYFQSATTHWASAVDSVSGLFHLEGEDVAIFADGNVVANPNNSSYTTYTVSSGAITLDQPYAVIHVGLPYTTDIETLDVDNAAGETLADKYMRVSKVTIHMEKTRGLFVGSAPPADDSTDPLEGLYELKARNAEGYDESISLDTTKAVINIQPEWNSNGRVFIRQIDPLPMSILAISPDGNFPFKGGA